jgi:hypothetical protein
MSALRRHLLLTETARRLVAVGGIALVLLLSALTASPDLHRLVHDHHDAGTEDGCAVVQFAHGASVTPDTALVDATPLLWCEFARPDVSEIFLTSPRSLHPPERGPPVV